MADDLVVDWSRVIIAAILIAGCANNQQTAQRWAEFESQ